MQRIFDIENKKDMQDLWDIFPTNIYRIEHRKSEIYLCNENYFYIACIPDDIIKINWHKKTEITRPVDYESVIGCVGWFDGCGDEIRLGILTKVAPNDEGGYCFLKNNNIWCKNFRPAKKSELKFYGD